MACGKSPALSISCFSILVLNLPFSFQTSDYCRFTVQDFNGNMKESNILRLIFFPSLDLGYVFLMPYLPPKQCGNAALQN